MQHYRPKILHVFIYYIIVLRTIYYVSRIYVTEQKDIGDN